MDWEAWAAAQDQASADRHLRSDGACFLLIQNIRDGVPTNVHKLIESLTDVDAGSDGSGEAPPAEVQDGDVDRSAGATVPGNPAT